MKDQKKQIHWGIIGLGKIAHKFVQDLLLVDNIVLEAVASRSKEKAKDFAETYDARSWFGSYEALFQNDNVDIVYIATPHSCHMDNTLLALAHRTAVLCEKPFAINAIQARKMIRAAKEQKTYLMEAMWSRFIPVIQQVKTLVDAGRIGEVSYIQADFAFKAPLSIQRVHDMTLGGGSLLDIGIYPVFLSYLLLGIPDEIKAKAQFFDSGADSQLSAILHYDNAQAVLHSSFLSHSERVAKISGTKGEIIIEAPWNESDGFKLFTGDDCIAYEDKTLGRGYTYQIQSSNDCLRRGQLENPLWTLQNSLELMELLDRIRAVIGLQYDEDRDTE
jgi:predicted dehydrogenase